MTSEHTPSRRRRSAALVNLIIRCLIAAMLAAGTGVLARAAPITSDATAPDPQLERRVGKLEGDQVSIIEALKSTNQWNQFIITGIGAFIGLLVGVQAVGTVIHFRRDRAREERHATADAIAAADISKIMQVIEETLRRRLDSEKEARNEAAQARAESQETVDRVDKFLAAYRATIQNERSAIEVEATRLAQHARQEFRAIADALGAFAQSFERFRSFQPFEDPPRDFSGRVFYALGIAAHYANRSAIAKEQLTRVIAMRQPDEGESQLDHNRRLASAYYYLGIIEANFGDHRRAIAFFQGADKHGGVDLEHRDPLTRLVIVEALIMNGELDRASQDLETMRTDIRARVPGDGRERRLNLRLQSRAALMAASIAISRGRSGWHEEAFSLLNGIRADDPDYYYATAMLGQVHAHRGDPEPAKTLFVEAYRAIERSGDLLRVLESRSRILLLMVAAMCCQNGLADANLTDDHLARADDLLDELPKIDGRVCTVFSPLSRRNENREVIRNHLVLIRTGTTIVGPQSVGESESVTVGPGGNLEHTG